MSVLALIPARAGSKGIKAKNLRRLGGVSLIEHAVRCAEQAGADLVRITTDIPHLAKQPTVIWRPEHLATDTAAMIDVVQHALAQIPGPDDQIVLLIQPTQPFRTPAHVKAAIALLQETQADSVVSVVELPQSHHPDLVLRIDSTGTLWPWRAPYTERPVRRQDVDWVYRADGTVYAFWRKTVGQHSTIYGRDVRPLIIPAHESCELDTEADWAQVEARWRART
jgi:CMP-N,N'-diacetyllegionaminic acid synthase